MDRNVILGILFGFGVGALAGYLIAKNTLEITYEEEYQDEIEKVREDLEAKYGVPREPKDEDAEKKLPKISSLVERTSFETPLSEKANYKRVITPYHKPDLATIRRAHEGTDIEFDEPTEEEEAAFMEEQEMEDAKIRSDIATNIDEREPYLIDYAAYTDERPEWDKIELYYYRFDDTMCDDNDKVVEDDDERIVNAEIFQTLQKRSNIFVRSEALQTDFEIHTLNASFAETVLSLNGETPKEQEFRRNGRRKMVLDSENETEDEE